MIGIWRWGCGSMLEQRFGYNLNVFVVVANLDNRALHTEVSATSARGETRYKPYR